MITSYYNTNRESKEQLAISKVKAFSQEEAIIDIFKDAEYYTEVMSPSDVWHIYCKEFRNVPLTSIRRAITNLTNRYKLVKTDITVNGEYGKPEHYWRLAKPKDKQIPLL